MIGERTEQGPNARYYAAIEHTTARRDMSSCPECGTTIKRNQRITFAPVGIGSLRECIHTECYTKCNSELSCEQRFTF